MATQPTNRLYQLPKEVRERMMGHLIGTDPPDMFHDIRFSPGRRQRQMLPPARLFFDGVDSIFRRNPRATITPSMMEPDYVQCNAINTLVGLTIAGRTVDKVGDASDRS